MEMKSEIMDEIQNSESRRNNCHFVQQNLVIFGLYEEQYFIEDQNQITELLSTISRPMNQNPVAHVCCLFMQVPSPISDIINAYSLSHHAYTDDTCIYRSRHLFYIKYEQVEN